MAAPPSGPSLIGKLIAVTGRTSGIGRATAKLMSSLGAKISIGDIQQDRLDEISDEIKSAGGEVFYSSHRRQEKTCSGFLDQASLK